MRKRGFGAKLKTLAHAIVWNQNFVNLSDLKSVLAKKREQIEKLKCWKYKQTFAQKLIINWWRSSRNFSELWLDRLLRSWMFWFGKWNERTFHSKKIIWNINFAFDKVLARMKSQWSVSIHYKNKNYLTQINNGACSVVNMKFKKVGFSTL